MRGSRLYRLHSHASRLTVPSPPLHRDGFSNRYARPASTAFATLTITQHTEHDRGTGPGPLRYNLKGRSRMVSRLVIVVHVLKIQDASRPVRFGRVNS